MFVDVFLCILLEVIALLGIKYTGQSLLSKFSAPQDFSRLCNVMPCYDCSATGIPTFFSMTQISYGCPRNGLVDS